jgi:hypothetical protein
MQAVFLLMAQSKIYVMFTDNDFKLCYIIDNYYPVVSKPFHVTAPTVTNNLSKKIIGLTDAGKICPKILLIYPIQQDFSGYRAKPNPDPKSTHYLPSEYSFFI